MPDGTGIPVRYKSHGAYLWPGEQPHLVVRASVMSRDPAGEHIKVFMLDGKNTAPSGASASHWLRQRGCRSDRCNRRRRSCYRHRRSGRTGTSCGYRSGRCNRRNHRFHTSPYSWGIGRWCTRRSALRRAWDAPGANDRRAHSPHGRHVAQMHAHNRDRGCDGAVPPGGAQPSS